jgi:hypothetical protein
MNVLFTILLLFIVLLYFILNSKVALPDKNKRNKLYWFFVIISFLIYSFSEKLFLGYSEIIRIIVIILLTIGTVVFYLLRKK